MQATELIPIPPKPITRTVAGLVELRVQERCTNTRIAVVHGAYWTTVMLKIMVAERIIMDADMRLMRRRG